MARSQGGQPDNGNATKHGLHRMRAVLRELGTTALDGRSAVAQALREFQAELEADLGGDPSTAQRTLIDLAGRQKLLLDTVDSWILQNPPVRLEGGDMKCASVLRDREQIAMNLAKYLGMLGLERKPKPVEGVIAYMARKAAEKEVAEKAAKEAAEAQEDA